MLTPPVENVRNSVVSILGFAEQIRYCQHNDDKPTQAQANTIMVNVAHDSNELVNSIDGEWDAATAKLVTVAALKKALENIER